jgi:hypothetical protein
LEDVGTDERIILKQLLKKEDVRVWTGTCGSSCEHGNKPSGSIKRQTFSW